jgi:hypothetical protein
VTLSGTSIGSNSLDYSCVAFVRLLLVRPVGCPDPNRAPLRSGAPGPLSSKSIRQHGERAPQF